MKKTYIAPGLEILTFNSMNLMTTSVPTGGKDNEDGETAESKYWGGGLFDEDFFSN